MRSPYDALPAAQRWSAVAEAVARDAAETQTSVRFTVGAGERIASAGSCFAGRLADALRSSGSAYFIAEAAPKWLSPEQQLAFGYRPFSARYGLVFTAAQLRQLFDRAYGRFAPRERFWPSGTGVIDPLRPRSTPPFASVEELENDRTRHLTAVRRMFETADVFLFTLGLTELWRDREDGTVFPYCPGVAGGTFDPGRYEFHNMTVAETVDDLRALLLGLRKVNPAARVILSVSPVPIGATMEPVHVAQASTYTKSVLRVAVDEMRAEFAFVDYFAAYELVSQSFLGKDPFTPDRRHLREGVVEAIVERFRKLYLSESRDAAVERAESIVVREELPCDEDILAR